MKIDKAARAILQSALSEDIGSGDVTSLIIPSRLNAKADFLFKEEGILCGVRVVEEIFRLLDEDLRFLPAAKDGESIDKGRVIGYVEGKCRSILAGERVAVNFLSHLSGVATLTAKFVAAVKGTSAKIYDTRKTTPLLRAFERYAVTCGGGVNHRNGLYDGVLIKDNHLSVLKDLHIKKIYESAKAAVTKRIPIGIEVKNPAEARAALGFDFQYILLDHFTLDQVRETVKIKKELEARPQLEVSGNVTLETVRGYAECGIERISIGALTHSADALDISLDLIT